MILPDNFTFSPTHFENISLWERLSSGAKSWQGTGWDELMRICSLVRDYRENQVVGQEKRNHNIYGIGLEGHWFSSIR
jgi:hypothetical protein